MNNEDSLSLLTPKPGNVKNAIIQKLSRQWPLTIKQLDHALKREFGMNVTYQAVHKVIKQLENEKVIEKTKNGLQLNLAWVEGIQKFTKKIKQEYSAETIFDPRKDVNELTFPTFLDTAKFIIHTFEEMVSNPEKKSGICIFRYAWPIIGANEEDFEQLHKSVRETLHYCVINSDMPMDHIFGEALIKLGKKVKYGIDCSIDYDIIAKGDYVAHVFFPKDFRNSLSKVYKRVKTIQELDLENFFSEVVSKKTTIKVIVVHSKELATIFREISEKPFIHPTAV